MPAPSTSGLNHAPTPDGLPVPRRYWAMAAIALAIAMSVLDSTIVNVALPTIAHELHASAAASIWIVNAYQLAILAVLLPLASLGEIAGFRRIWQTGLAVFALASLGCACAPTLLTLSIARVVQGLGAAGVMSVSAALVRFTYPQRQLGRAVGITALVVAASAALGPTIAAGVLAVAQWRWLFGVNVPLAVIAILIAVYALPDNAPAARRTPNYAGTALNAGTFVLLLGGLQSLAHHAATAPALVEIAAACGLGALLVRHELPRLAPIVPFDLLRIRVFSLSLAASVCSFMAQMTALVALPFEIQRLGHSAVQTGLLMTPWPLALAVAAPLAGRLADRYAAGMLGALGLLVMACGLVLLALFPAGGAPGFIWRMALCGLGFGFFQSPNNRAIIASAPRERSGAAGGMLSAARLLGQSLGAAAVAILFRSYAAAGSQVALWVAAALALSGAAVSALRLTGRDDGASASSEGST